MATRLVRFVAIFLASWWASVAAAQTVTYTVNSNGQVATATYYNGTTVVYAYDASGNRLSAVVTPDTTPPSAPGTPSATGITGTTASVSWSAATDNFQVACYSYQLNGGSWSSCVSELSVGLTGLANATTYTVGVRAQDAAGNVGATSTYTFMTADTTPPSAPGTPTASAITATTATVSWTAATDNVGVTGYSYQLNGGSWSAFTTPLSVNLTGLTNGTTYTVGVRAHDAAGNIGATATGSFSSIDTTPPSAPGTPTASNVTGTTATVSWTAATDNVGVTGYSYQLNGGSWSAFTSPLSVNLTGLSWGTAYTVGVRAEDAAGNVGPTATGSFTSTPDTTPPSAPGIPTASSITGTTATISWTAATDNVGVVGYSYQLNGGSWSTWSAGLSANLTGLSVYTTYTVGVRAHDAAGNIGPTATGSFMTLDTIPPGAPGTPTASSITGNSATVSWTAATDNVGVTGYSYQLNGGAWSSFSNGLSVNLTGLANYASYSVGVRAEDSAGNIGPTATGSFTTLDTILPSAPGTPSASNITSSSATVSWTAATDSVVGVTGYSYQLNGGTWSPFYNVLSVNLTGLANYSNYTFGVRAQDAVGNIGPTATGSFQTLDSVLPSAPGTPTASSITSTSATVSWTAATDSVVGVTGYSYQLNGGAWSSFSNVLSVNLTGLTSGTAYTVGVRAQDAVGNIGPTATGSFTTSYVISQATLTSGTYSVPPYLVESGYFTGYGSINPHTISGALTYSAVYDITSVGPHYVGEVAVAGFASDPGTGWLISAQVGSTSKTGTSAGYSYSGGTATWTWTSLFGIGSTQTVTLTHK